MTGFPTYITVKKACEMIGGDKPIAPSTYYRGVQAGIYPAPVRVGPMTARVDQTELAAALRARVGEDPSK
jgi:hypothetical protein